MYFSYTIKSNTYGITAYGILNARTEESAKKILENVYSLTKRDYEITKLEKLSNELKNSLNGVCELNIVNEKDWYTKLKTSPAVNEDEAMSIDASLSHNGKYVSIINHDGFQIELPTEQCASDVFNMMNNIINIFDDNPNAILALIGLCIDMFECQTVNCQLSTKLMDAFEEVVGNKFKRVENAYVNPDHLNQSADTSVNISKSIGSCPEQLSKALKKERKRIQKMLKKYNKADIIKPKKKKHKKDKK